MKRHALVALLVLAVVAAFMLPAGAQPPARLRSQTTRLVVPMGTDVPLVFDQGLSSRTARVGDRVRLHVARNIQVGRFTVLRRGTPVSGVVSRVDKRKRFGVNAKLRIALNPVRSTYGTLLPLQPRSQGRYVSGEKSGKAAAAAAGGAVVLGPVGLVGGYFVTGKPVTIRPGDRLLSEVAQTTVIGLRSTAYMPYRPGRPARG